METKKTKIFPCCGEEILAVAKKCRHCSEWLEEMSKTPVTSKDKTQTLPSEGVKPTNGQIVTKPDEKREESNAKGSIEKWRDEMAYFLREM